MFFSGDYRGGRKILDFCSTFLVTMGGLSREFDKCKTFFFEGFPNLTFKKLFSVDTLMTV